MRQMFLDRGRRGQGAEQTGGAQGLCPLLRAGLSKRWCPWGRPGLHSLRGLLGHDLLPYPVLGCVSRPPPRDPAVGGPCRQLGPWPSQVGSSSPGRQPPQRRAGWLGLRVTCGVEGAPGRRQHVAEAQVSPGSRPCGH